VSDLTPERLARLRVWATRHRPPSAGRDIGRHEYDGACPWCRSDDLAHQTIDGFIFDGNAHDVAIELLDEIDRLRTIVEDVAAEGAPLTEDGCGWCGVDVGHKPDCAWLKVEQWRTNP